MKFTNTYRYVVLKQVMFLILFLIILVCMIKIDLEYLKQEVRIVFAKRKDAVSWHESSL